MKKLVAAFIATTFATSAFGAPVQWTAGSGGNDHWYDFVILDTAIAASEAEAVAEASSLNGSIGYLATITSSAEQSFLNSVWPGVGSVVGQFNDLSYFLIGASDATTEGDFRWLGGPEDGDVLSYTNWAAGEPNNENNEDYVVAWWDDSPTGEWNDYLAGEDIRGYVVEYADAVPTVPLPASAPLILAALGGLGLIRRRVKS